MKGKEFSFSQLENLPPLLASMVFSLLKTSYYDSGRKEDFLNNDVIKSDLAKKIRDNLHGLGFSNVTRGIESEIMKCLSEKFDKPDQISPVALGAHSDEIFLEAVKQAKENLHNILREDFSLSLPTIWRTFLNGVPWRVNAYKLYVDRDEGDEKREVVCIEQIRLRVVLEDSENQRTYLDIHSTPTLDESSDPQSDYPKHMAEIWQQLLAHMNDHPDAKVIGHWE